MSTSPERSTRTAAGNGSEVESESLGATATELSDRSTDSATEETDQQLNSNAIGKNEKSGLQWVREMPQGVRIGIISAAGAAALTAGGLKLFGNDTAPQESTPTGVAAEESFDPEAAGENNGNINDTPENGDQDSYQDNGESLNSNDEIENENVSNSPGSEKAATYNKEEWLQKWSDENYVNGKRFEDISLEHRQGMKDYVNDVKSNFTRKLSVVTNAETEEELMGDSVREVQYLTGMRLLIENEDGIFPVENPAIYGIRPKELNGESDDPAVWGWNERADSTAPDYDSFMIVYPDQNQEWQAISLHWFGASFPSDSSTRLVGTYMHNDYKTPEIVRGVLDWESLQTDDESYVIENQNSEGSVQIKNSAPSFDTIEEAWDSLEKDGQYKPVSMEKLLEKTPDI